MKLENAERCALRSHCADENVQVFKDYVEKSFDVHEIVKVKQDHRSCHVRLVK
jgi:hypothetical protein